MAKLKIPAGIEKAIADGKTVIWVQRGAYDHKKGCHTILPRINDKVAKYYQIEALIKNLHVRSWERTHEFYLGDKLIGMVPAEDLYIDIAIMKEYYKGGERYEHICKVNFFSEDTTNKMEIRERFRTAGNEHNYYFTKAALETSEAQIDASTDNITAEEITEKSTSIKIEASVENTENEAPASKFTAEQVNASIAGEYQVISNEVISRDELADLLLDAEIELDNAIAAGAREFEIRLLKADVESRRCALEVQNEHIEEHNQWLQYWFNELAKISDADVKSVNTENENPASLDDTTEDNADNTNETEKEAAETESTAGDDENVGGEAAELKQAEQSIDSNTVIAALGTLAISALAALFNVVKAPTEKLESTQSAAAEETPTAAPDEKAAGNTSKSKLDATRTKIIKAQDAIKKNTRRMMKLDAKVHGLGTELDFYEKAFNATLDDGALVTYSEPLDELTYIASQIGDKLINKVKAELTIATLRARIAKATARLEKLFSELAKLESLESEVAVVVA